MLRETYDRIVALPPIKPIKPAWQRSRFTTTPLRFFFREWFVRRSGANYWLRDAPDVPLALRHNTPDPEALDQIFMQGAVAEPAPVAERLDALGRPPRIIDLGANVGIAAAWFARRWPDATIVCVEPDPVNLSALNQAAARSGGRWRVVEAAAASKPGVLEFALGRDAVSRALPGGGVMVEAIDFFELAGRERPDLVKIDIEGGEWDLLADPRLADLGAVAIGIEVHPHLCPGADPRSEAIPRLKDAGYEVLEVPHVHGAPPEEASLWAWRP